MERLYFDRQPSLTMARVNGVLGAIHTSELDRSEIDLSSKRSECERDLNECEHFLKAN